MTWWNPWWFKFEGGTVIQHDAIESRLRSMTFPWERILAGGPVTISLVPFPTLGTATPTVVQVSAQDSAEHLAEVVPHEMFHLLDARFVLPRDALIKLFCNHTPLHTWRGGEHHERIAEAFAEAGKLIFSGGTYGGLGDHQIPAGWFTPLVLASCLPFSDVASLPDDAINDIALVKAHEVTQGVGGGLFDPSSQVTRVQMAQFLARILRKIY